MIFTALNVFAGVSLESLKPKSLLANALLPSSKMVTVLFAPTGASLTGVTLIVMVFAAGSNALIPSPPLSCTWKVKLA